MVTIKTILLVTKLSGLLVTTSGWVAISSAPVRAKSMMIRATSDDGESSSLSNWMTSAFLATALVVSAPDVSQASTMPSLPAAQQQVPPTLDENIAIKVDVNIPTLTKTIKQNQSTINKSIQDVQTALKPTIDLLEPSIKVQTPKDVKTAVRDALSGEGEIIVNGKVLDLFVTSEKGSLAFKVDSPLLPRFPILPFPSDREKAIESAVASKLTSLPSIFQKVKSFSSPVEDIDAKLSEEVEIVGSNDINGEDENKMTLAKFMNQDFPYNDMLGIQVKNGQVAISGTIVGVIGAYGGSYWYYTSEIERIEREAAEKKKKLALKKKKSITSKKSQNQDKDKEPNPKALKEPEEVSTKNVNTDVFKNDIAGETEEQKQATIKTEDDVKFSSKLVNVTKTTTKGEEEKAEDEVKMPFKVENESDGTLKEEEQRIEDKVNLKSKKEEESELPQEEEVKNNTQTRLEIKSKFRAPKNEKQSKLSRLRKAFSFGRREK